MHTAAAFPSNFVAAHLAASVMFLVLAVVFWLRSHSYASTIFYAMTGYAALSMAIIKATAGRGGAA